MIERLRELDNRVLGRPLPDDRSRWQRWLRPRVVGWSARGQMAMLAVLAVMFATVVLWPGAVWSAVVMIAVWVAAFLIAAAEERKRSRDYYNGTDK